MWEGREGGGRAEGKGERGCGVTDLLNQIFYPCLLACSSTCLLAYRLTCCFFVFAKGGIQKGDGAFRISRWGGMEWEREVVRVFRERDGVMGVGRCWVLRIWGVVISFGMSELLYHLPQLRRLRY